MSYILQHVAFLTEPSSRLHLSEGVKHPRTVPAYPFKKCKLL